MRRLALCLALLALTRSASACTGTKEYCDAEKQYAAQAASARARADELKKAGVPSEVANAAELEARRAENNLDLFREQNHNGGLETTPPKTPAETARSSNGSCAPFPASSCAEFNRLIERHEQAVAAVGATGGDQRATSDAMQRLRETDAALTNFQKANLPQSQGAALAGVDEAADAGLAGSERDALARLRAAQAAGRRALENVAPSAGAQSQLQGGDPKGALKTIDKVLADHPNDPQAYQTKAQALDQLGRHDEAAAAMRRFAELDPAAAQLMQGHGSQLSRAEGISSKARGLSFGETRDAGAGPQGGAQNGARPGYAQAAMISLGGQVPPAPALPPGVTLTAAKSPSQLLVEKAWQKLKLGDKTGALLAATAAIDADPKNTWAWTIRAEVENDMGKYPPAETDATQAVAIDAANARAYRARAYAELEDGKYEAALADGQRAIELEPGNGLGYLYRAMALEKLGRGAEALADYQKAVALDPTLHALADDAIARLSGKPGASAVSSSSPFKKPLVRGGLIAGSLALVLFGLLGTEAGRRLTTRPARSAPSEETVAQPARAALAPGLVLAGNYRLERELGRGGMGVVFEATDQALQRRVAIKQLQRDGDAERFLTEARLVAKLKHPNLAQIYNVIEEGELYLVFEYVDGQGLDRALALSRKLPPASAASVIKEVCEGVAYAHSQGIIHRDLKPSNIMLGRDGKAKVLDFGVAHQSRSGAALTRTSAAGTPPYMAPEQALGSSSRASDLYALAVMAYEMVTGSRPFEGPDFLEQKLQRQFAPPTRKDPGLSAALDGFFATALDPDPTKRHGDAARFAQAFSEATRA